MNTLDLLLSIDTAKITEKLNKEIEITRLSKIIGDKFIVTCYPLTNDQVKHLTELNTTSDADAKLNVINESCRIDGKKFSDKSLREKFSAISGVEVVSKLFNPGEIYDIYVEINKLSGYTSNAVVEVKN